MKKSNSTSMLSELLSATDLGSRRHEVPRVEGLKGKRNLSTSNASLPGELPLSLPWASPVRRQVCFAVLQPSFTQFCFILHVNVHLSNTPTMYNMCYYTLHPAVMHVCICYAYIINVGCEDSPAFTTKGVLYMLNMMIYLVQDHFLCKFILFSMVSVQLATFCFYLSLSSLFPPHFH